MTFLPKLLTLLTAALLLGASANLAGDNLPAQIKVLTQTLRDLNESDLANRLEQDLKAKRVTIGNTGDARAVTGVGVLDRSVLLRPLSGVTGLGTGTTDNSMTISDKILRDIMTDPRAVTSAGNMNNVVGWALTLRHEYLHMGQVDPHPTPEFENPAYRETLKTGVSWYNLSKAELKEALQAFPTKENLDKINGIFIRMNALGQQVNDTFNDMPERFKDESLNPDTWVTLDGGHTQDPSEAKRQNWETMGRDKADFSALMAKFAADSVPGDQVNARIRVEGQGLLDQTFSWNASGNKVNAPENILLELVTENFPLKISGLAFQGKQTKSANGWTIVETLKGRFSPDCRKIEELTATQNMVLVAASGWPRRDERTWRLTVKNIPLTSGLGVGPRLLEYAMGRYREVPPGFVITAAEYLGTYAERDDPYAGDGKGIRNDRTHHFDPATAWVQIDFRFLKAQVEREIKIPKR